MCGILDAALEQAAGLHHLVARVMHRGSGVIAAADERIFIRVLRHARKIFGDLDAGNIGLDGLVGSADFGGSIGLHVPGVELRGPADQEQHDAILIGLGGVGSSHGLHGKQVRESQSQERQRAGVQEITATEAVTKLYGVVGIEAKHSRCSLFGLLWVGYIQKFIRVSLAKQIAPGLRRSAMRAGAIVAGV